jgi:hypothetical protein
MPPERGLDYIAGEELLNRHPPRRSQRTSVILPVDFLDDLP